MKNMVKLSALSVLFYFCFIASSFAQDASIVGKWKTIDDKTNEPKSIVQIYEKDGKYFGQIKELFRKPGEDPDPVCDKCPDDDPRKNQAPYWILKKVKFTHANYGLKTAILGSEGISSFSTEPRPGTGLNKSADFFNRAEAVIIGRLLTHI